MSEAGYFSAPLLNALLILNLRLDVCNRIARFNLHGYSLSGESLYKNLHFSFRSSRLYNIRNVGLSGNWWVTRRTGIVILLMVLPHGGRSYAKSSTDRSLVIKYTILQFVRFARIVQNETFVIFGARVHNLVEQFK